MEKKKKRAFKKKSFVRKVYNSTIRCEFQRYNNKFCETKSLIQKILMGRGSFCAHSAGVRVNGEVLKFF